MAAVASSAVTIVDSWESGNRAGALKELTVRASITLSSQGTASNPIPASVLGLSKVYTAVVESFIVSSNPKAAIAIVDATGANVLVANLNQATDANRYDPADVSGTLNLRVTGLPAV